MEDADDAASLVDKLEVVVVTDTIPKEDVYEWVMKVMHNNTC